MKHLPKIEGEPYEYKAWPSWATGPNGERRIFDSEAEVPAGWTHHGKTGSGKPAPVKTETVTEASSTGGVDAAGVTFDPERHTGTKTKAGLWRMKVGVSRPEAESEILDL